MSDFEKYLEDKNPDKPCYFCGSVGISHKTVFLWGKADKIEDTPVTCSIAYERIKNDSLAKELV